MINLGSPRPFDSISAYFLTAMIPCMKLVSFNINGLRARPHQLEALIQQEQPAVIGLQEIKVADEQFPRETIEAIAPDYEIFHHGQKGHYGVALLTNLPVERIEYGFPTDEPDAQKRMIIAHLEQPNGRPLTVLNGYFPQGENESHETKFPAKAKFYEDLQNYLTTHCDPSQDLVVMGDINISPIDVDIGIGEVNKKRWLKSGKCSFLPIEREWLARLKSWGLTDSFRALHPEADDQFSWFDYRSRGFDDNRGLRIDVVMATDSLMARLTQSEIGYGLRAMEKPSDHAPVWSTFDE